MMDGKSAAGWATALAIAATAVGGWYLKGKTMMAQEAREVVEQRVQPLEYAVDELLQGERRSEDRDLWQLCMDYPTNPDMAYAEVRADCDRESQWRWETLFPWRDCEARERVLQREGDSAAADLCGPEPRREP